MKFLILFFSKKWAFAIIAIAILHGPDLARAQSNVTAQRAPGGAVSELIAEARIVGPRHNPTKVAMKFIVFGLHGIGPSGIDEAVDILESQAESEDVLAALMRGLAFFPEAANFGISSTYCLYTGPSYSGGLQAEARESLRIRCILGDPDSCDACPSGPPGPLPGPE